MIVLAKFLVVGLSNTLISYLAFLVLYFLIFNENVFVSQCISYAVGIFWSFYWNKKWTFSKKRHSMKTFIPFFSVQLFLLFFSALLLDFASAIINWNISIVWVGTMCIVTLMNFVLSKKIVFKV